MAGRGGYRPGSGRKPGKVSQARRDLAEAAKEHADAALQVLVDVAGDETQTGSARIAAANAILDRGHGRPAQAVQVDASLAMARGPAAHHAAVEKLMAELDRIREREAAENAGH